MLCGLPITYSHRDIGKHIHWLSYLLVHKSAYIDRCIVYKYSLNNVVWWKKARFSYKNESWHENHSLSSDVSSPSLSLSRMSEQQSSMMSSQGEPNEKASVEHCWLVEPITKPILQASQQSWGFQRHKTAMTANGNLMNGRKEVESENWNWIRFLTTFFTSQKMNFFKFTLKNSVP